MLIINSTEGQRFIDESKILYGIADGSYTKLVLTDQIVIISKNLTQVLSKIDSELFVRIHRSHFINLSHVVAYKNGKDRTVLMNNEEELELAEDRKPMFLKMFTIL